MRLIIEVKNPTEELTGIYFSLRSWDISLALNMTYYLSPIGTSCHFAYAADAPLLSLSRHFPRFSGGIYPEGGSELPSLRAKRSNLPGGAKTIILIVIARERSDRGNPSE